MKKTIMSVFGNQVLGTRKIQEDYFSITVLDDTSDPKYFLLLLADGMGGHAGGAEASRLAASAFVDRYRRQGGPVIDRLSYSLDASTDALKDYIAKDPVFSDMGTTLLAVIIKDNTIQWISVGDSILWIIRADGELVRLNSDHSMAPVLDELYESGRLSAKEALTDPKRNALRSAVTGDVIEIIDRSSQPIAITDTDILILASDGISTLSDHEILDIVKAENGSAESYVTSLLQEVEKRKKKRQDNTTVIIRKVLLNSITSQKKHIAKSSFKKLSKTDKFQIQNKYFLPKVIAIICMLIALVFILYISDYKFNFG